jgi:HSP20 family molecular chaperone IbpA
MKEETSIMSAQELSVREKQEVQREEPTRPGRTYLPDVDICETVDALWLWADMPGVREDRLTINLDQGVLSIEGTVAVKEYENLTPVYSEYNVGNYLRRFTLSDAIDPNGIKARIKDGVLELEMHKTERAKPRRIAVSTS